MVHFLRVVQEHPLQVVPEHLPQPERLLLEHLRPERQKHNIQPNRRNYSCCVSCSVSSCSVSFCSVSSCSRTFLFRR